MATTATVHASTRLSEDDGDFLEVLILDDLETDRKRLVRLCKRAGLKFRAHEADTVQAFRQKLDGASPDIVFLDYALGYETGLDALKELRADPRHDNAIAIMVSSLDDLDLAIQAMRLGCADYINKEELSPEAIRKSVALSFERRLLLSTLVEAQESEQSIRLLMARMARTCGSEIRSVIEASLEHIKAGNVIDFEGLSQSLHRLDQLCKVLAELGKEAAKTSGSDADIHAMIGPRSLERTR